MFLLPSGCYTQQTSNKQTRLQQALVWSYTQNTNQTNKISAAFHVNLALALITD
jgi:hypothetical protein